MTETPLREDLCAVGGVRHGGAVMAFAETLGAVRTALTPAPGRSTTTTDSSTAFIATAPAGGVATQRKRALGRFA